LIAKYKDEATGKTLAMSRWQADDQTCSKQCEVIKFYPQEDLFSVQWCHNKLRKKVARFNL